MERIAWSDHCFTFKSIRSQTEYLHRWRRIKSCLGSSVFCVNISFYSLILLVWTFWPSKSFVRTEHVSKFDSWDLQTRYLYSWTKTTYKVFLAAVFYLVKTYVWHLLMFLVWLQTKPWMLFMSACTCIFSHLNMN